MNFKTKIAYTAVLATLGMVAGSAQAAYLSDLGTGQALIYPYYTVQGGYDTYINVVNTTSRAKAVKVRLLEAKASAEVLDFNLYLSPYDVWAAAITPVDRNDATKGGKLVASDKSCTDPYRPNGINEPFRNFQYTGDNDDGMNDGSLARTREGYVEIIEMGPITNNTIATGVTHKNGVPTNCTPALTMTNSDVGAPTGGLIGTGTLINVTAGTDYSYDPVAIDDLFDAGQFALPGSVNPSLALATPSSVVIRRNDVSSTREVVTSNWGLVPTINAVNAILAHRNVMNEYTVEAGLGASTDWVVTFPTKRATIGSTVATSTAAQPFTKKLTSSGACEPVVPQYWDREEQTPGTTTDFSPLPPSGKNELCWEANVITFNGANVLSSALPNKPNLDMTVFGYQNGWMNLGFSNSSQKLVNTAATSINGGVATATATYSGLPAIGFAVERIINTTLPGSPLSNYGGSFVHKYTRDVAVVPAPIVP